MAESYDIPKKKLTDEEYKAWWRGFLDHLRTLPEDKLSPVAKYWLKMDGKENEWDTTDLKAVFG